MTRILEFKTILGEVNFPYKHADAYIFKFSSKDTINQLNKLFKDLFDLRIVCEQLQNSTIKKEKIPEKLLQVIPNITNNVLKKLEKDYKFLEREEEDSDQKLILIDRFIHHYGLSLLQINLYYDAEGEGKGN